MKCAHFAINITRELTDSGSLKERFNILVLDKNLDERRLIPLLCVLNLSGKETQLASYLSLA